MIWASPATPYDVKGFRLMRIKVQRLICVVPGFLAPGRQKLVNEPPEANLGHFWPYLGRRKLENELRETTWVTEGLLTETFQSNFEGWPKPFSRMTPGGSPEVTHTVGDFAQGT